MKKPLQLKLLTHGIEFISAIEGCLDYMCILMAFFAFDFDFRDVLKASSLF